ncbi:MULTISPECIES: glycosyltransferase [unclassified Caballeronia]|uniref:glycosyltransferase n=1 Tax=unclassified Caballeronia TaxID=2646786 RepID=UPI00202950AC|nr:MULTISPECIES: glycosyltransferase [unclassified Caballeronia]MDR5804246.1 glycosyltransferase [Caballeronia sp. LZ001]
MNALSDVAVLIPAYNGQADLERTLASFDETSPVQVLIVDDGSTPPIVAPIIDGMRIAILRLPENGGIERALQAGIEALAARGLRYAARIDSGDLATPGRLAMQRAYLEAHPRVAALGMWTHVVATGGAPLFDLTPPTEPDTIRRMMLARSCFAHPSLMLRVEAVREVGNYRADYRAAEDLDLLLRLLARYDGANLPAFGLYYELNENGISATKRRTQTLSTLRLQWRYLRAGNVFDWAGIGKSIAHLLLPYRALKALKAKLLRPSTPTK